MSSRVFLQPPDYCSGPWIIAKFFPSRILKPVDKSYRISCTSVWLFFKSYLWDTNMPIIPLCIANDVDAAKKSALWLFFIFYLAINTTKPYTGSKIKLQLWYKEICCLKRTHAAKMQSIDLNRICLLYTICRSTLDLF